MLRKLLVQLEFLLYTKIEVIRVAYFGKGAAYAQKNCSAKGLSDSIYNKK